MRKSIFITTLACLMALHAHAQMTLKSITATEGKGAMTSGIDFTIMLTDTNGWLYGAQANNERSNVRVGRTFGEFTLIMTAGAFKNVPWTGAMLSYDHKGLGLFSWTGFGMGTDKHLTDPGWQPGFFFNYEEASYTFGKNKIAYAALFFTTEPMCHFAVYRREVPLDNVHKLFVETTWDFQEEIPMFVIGYKHSFND